MALGEQRIESVGHHPDANTEVSDELRDDRNGDNVARRECRCVPLVSSKRRDSVAPSAERIHRDGEQLPNLALGVAHCS
jgi:hypothetical protein